MLQFGAGCLPWGYCLHTCYKCCCYYYIAATAADAAAAVSSLLRAATHLDDRPR
jgi:hypothetical protein